MSGMVQFTGYIHTMGFYTQNIIYEQQEENMINNEKVALMTKLAMYEEKEKNRDIAMSRYYKGDYVTFHVINSLIAGTLVYCLILLSIAMVNIEKLLTDLATMDLFVMGKKIIILYLVFIVLYGIISYLVYSQRFKKSRQGINSYNADLKKLYGMYTEKNKAESGEE